MTASPQLNRRSLLVSAAAIGGGLSLGLRIPFGLAGAQAADSLPEVNAWVIIRPDDTVVIRIARSRLENASSSGNPSALSSLNHGTAPGLAGSRCGWRGSFTSCRSDFPVEKN